MRFLVRTAATTWLIGCLCSPALAQVSEQEPNDACAMANDAGAAPLAGAVQGQLDPPTDPARTDVDFFRFTGSPGQRLAVLLNTSTAFGRVGLFDEQCNLLRSGTAQRPLRFDVPERGTFTIGVADRSDPAFTGNGEPDSRFSYEVFVYPPEDAIGSIAGRVVDAVSGNPLPGAIQPFAGVLLSICFEDGECRLVDVVRADVRGEFRFETDASGFALPVGTYRVDAAADDHETLSSQIRVGADENADLGDLALPLQPLLFSDIRPCTELPPQGTTCEYSALVRNTTSAPVSGIALSVVSRAGFRSGLSFEATTRSSGIDAERARLALGPFESRTVRFSFELPSFVPERTLLCVDLQFGTAPAPLLRPLRRQELFCMEKSRNRFTVLGAAETRAALERAHASEQP